MRKKLCLGRARVCVDLSCALVLAGGGRCANNFPTSYSVIKYELFHIQMVACLYLRNWREQKLLRWILAPNGRLVFSCVYIKQSFRRPKCHGKAFTSNIITLRRTCSLLFFVFLEGGEKLFQRQKKNVGKT